MHNPLQVHWVNVKRILRYLTGTMNYGLDLTKSPHNEMVAFCDADWAANVDDQRSSTEAEFRSLANVVAKLTWLHSLLFELHATLPRPQVLWCDNLSTVLLTVNLVLHARTKHIELDLYFVREKIMQQLVDIRHVPAVGQIADGLTIFIFSNRFNVF
uniref:Uncharacterized protein n=1 Tax=Cannabis sativa TaxID=3483 RepID=A0A803NS27_CANSA